MAIPKEKIYTAEEFFELTPESSSERYELVNGNIIALAAPNIMHQEISGGIYSEFRSFIKNKNGKCKPLVSPVDVKLNNNNVVQPDVLVICDQNKIDDKRCNGAPDLVVEVTSSNSQYDYVHKLKLYYDAGVREYWIVDTKYNRTLVYFWENDNSPSIYTFEQDIPVGIFNNELNINIADML